MVFQQGSNGFRSKLAGSLILLVILVICLILSLRGRTNDKLPVSNIRATELFDSFALDPAYAYFKYFKQVLVVEGQVLGINGRCISLGSGVRIVKIDFQKATFRKLPPIGKGENLVIKGVCFGLDYGDVRIGSPDLIAHIPSL